MDRSVPPHVQAQEREAFYDRAGQLTPFLGARTGSGVYIVRTHDKHIGRSLFTKRARGEMRVLNRAIETLDALHGGDTVVGKSFIDVGANIGTTTVPALLEHGFARAIAIEPEEENFITLRLNAVLNQVDDRIVPLCKAASNQSGMLDLIVSQDQGGKHWIATDERRKARARSTDEVVRVEAVTLDQLAEASVFDPDLTGMLWIDAQAHEGHIIEGATALTSRGVPIVLEWDPAGLDRQGDRGKIHAIAERDYTHFAGMRADPIDDGPKFWLRPVDELDDYAERFLDPARSEKFTDIMLLRLVGDEVPDDHVADQIDLYTVVKRHTQAKRDTQSQTDGPIRRLGRKLRAVVRRLTAPSGNRRDG